MNRTTMTWQGDDVRFFLAVARTRSLARWQKRGFGTGFLVDESGLAVILMASKTSQDQTEKIVVSRADMPSAR
jgi:hypothetical protein